MARLIDADALLGFDEVCKGVACVDCPFCISTCYGGCKWFEFIKSQPTIEAEITTEKAIEYLVRTDWLGKHDIAMINKGMVRQRKLNAIEAEPVVHCKDCKWWNRNSIGSDGFALCNEMNGQSYWQGSDYCSWGEKMGEVE